MIEAKLSNCNIKTSGMAVPMLSKQQPTTRKTVQRDVPSEPRSFIQMLSEVSERSSRSEGPEMDAIKAANKRFNAECPVARSLFHLGRGNEDKRPRQDPAQTPWLQSTCSGSNGQLVYVRRKAEPEQAKLSNVSQPACQDSVSLVPRKIPSDAEYSMPNSTPVQSREKFRSLSAARFLPVERTQERKPWKQRFEELQKYLKFCDESGREEYVQMLRSLTPAERSQHAVDLEIRAIQLSVLQVRELQKIMAYNMMDKSSSKNGHCFRSPPVTSSK